MRATKLVSIATGLAMLAPLTGGANEETGQAIYERHCLVCHQANGGGVPMMQPSLRGSRRVVGAPDELIKFVDNGSTGLAPEERQYDNDMPGFSHLSDKEMSVLLSYIRKHFGTDADAITPDQVQAARR